MSSSSLNLNIEWGLITASLMTQIDVIESQLETRNERIMFLKNILKTLNRRRARSEDGERGRYIMIEFVQKRIQEQ